MCPRWRTCAWLRAMWIACLQRRCASGRSRSADKTHCFWGRLLCTPTRQGEGLAALLIGRSLEKAKNLGWERIMLVGDAPYYGRFGFTRLDSVAMPPPTNPARVLGLDLQPGGWNAVSGDVTPAID